jgi:hydrogenase maturation protein HypF
MSSLKISIKGVVQGVGFRPFVYNLAKALSIRGFIINTSDGVMMIAEGDSLDVFIERIRKEPPPLARIMSMDISPVAPVGFPDFSIRESEDTGSFTLISPDISICDDCLHELFDGNDRRFLYPFINCTHCGPRYSITKSVPYDRINTTMRVFAMCIDCKTEYGNTADRRFHAQPNACPECGPAATLITGRGQEVSGRLAVEKTIELLKGGGIVAIKGLGGFHLASDATNKEAVKRLRERKRRSNKPFALMAPGVEAIRKFCCVSEDEASLLCSEKRPIVLLRKHGLNPLPDAVSPNNSHIGFMLPYTPLHYLLFHQPQADGPSITTHFDALVMTSGNISEEPVVISNEEAVSKLSGIADAFLIHNREIFMRVDDSVLKVGSAESNDDDKRGAADRSSRTFYIRRARGYVPEPIPLSDEGPDVLGCGADLKNTLTLTTGSYAIPSQHIGDMENYETLRFFEETLHNLMSVYRASPEALAYDLHPGYLSTKWALKQAEDGIFRGIKTYGIQHHYAHIASVMAERGIRQKIIGVAFDGTGFGEDGTLWGGEFLIADIEGFKRAGHLKCVPLPGGEMAVREPWRVSLSYIKKAAGDALWDYIGPSGFAERYGKDKIEKIIKVGGERDFSPLSSGAGRLFDAVSALTGACDKNTFEGEAAIALEALVLQDVDEDYPVDISFRDPMEIDFSMTILSILNDMEKGENKRIISTKFHNTVGNAVIAVVSKLSLVNNIGKVVLSGGVFQNLYLLNRAVNSLRSAGFEVYVNESVPCNDAGISLGQAYIIRERLKKGI